MHPGIVLARTANVKPWRADTFNSRFNVCLVLYDYEALSRDRFSDCHHPAIVVETNGHSIGARGKKLSVRERHVSTWVKPGHGNFASIDPHYVNSAIGAQTHRTNEG